MAYDILASRYGPSFNISLLDFVLFYHLSDKNRKSYCLENKILHVNHYAKTVYNELLRVRDFN